MTTTDVSVPLSSDSHQLRPAGLENKDPATRKESKACRIALLILANMLLLGVLAYGSSQLGSCLWNANPLKVGLITGGSLLGLFCICLGIALCCIEESEKEQSETRSVPVSEPLHLPPQASPLAMDLATSVDHSSTDAAQTCATSSDSQSSTAPSASEYDTPAHPPSFWLNHHAFRVTSFSTNKPSGEIIWDMTETTPDYYPVLVRFLNDATLLPNRAFAFSFRSESGEENTYLCIMNKSSGKMIKYSSKEKQAFDHRVRRLAADKSYSYQAFNLPPPHQEE